MHFICQIFYCSYDFPLVFGVDIQTTLTKAERLIYGESMMTHAMAITAIATNVMHIFVYFFVHNPTVMFVGER